MNQRPYIGRLDNTSDFIPVISGRPVGRKVNKKISNYVDTPFSERYAHKNAPFTMRLAVVKLCVTMGVCVWVRRGCKEICHIWLVDFEDVRHSCAFLQWKSELTCLYICG
jgi:hypothetical protein